VPVGVAGKHQDRAALRRPLPLFPHHANLRYFLRSSA